MWSHTGNYLSYNSNVRNQVDFDISLAKINSDKSTTTELILQKEGNWYPVCWSFDDRFLIVSKYISALSSEPYLLDLQNKTSTKLFSTTEKVAFKKIIFSKSNDLLYIVSNAETEFLQLRTYQIKTGKQQILTESLNWNIVSFDLDYSGKNLAFISNENGYYQLYLLDTASNQFKTLPNIPNGQISQIKFDKSGAFLAMNISNSAYANQVFVYDLNQFNSTQWTAQETTIDEGRSFVEPTLVHYPSFDILKDAKRQIPAFCYLPNQQGKFPTLIHIHGGPEGQFVPDYQPFFQYLINHLGIAIVAPNVRGSRGYGKTYLALDDGYKREYSVKDIGCLLEWIAQHPNLNEQQVAVSGGSYGGYMVYAALFHYSRQLACGISRVGISNFVTFLENTKAYRRNNRREEYGDERIPEMRTFLHSISPTTHAQQITKPLLIVQGGNDPRVPKSESIQMYNAVKNNNVPTWYVLANDEGHGFKKKKNIDYYHQVAIAFLKRYLLLE